MLAEGELRFQGNRLNLRAHIPNHNLLCWDSNPGTDSRVSQQELADEVPRKGVKKLKCFPSAKEGQGRGVAGGWSRSISGHCPAMSGPRMGWGVTWAAGLLVLKLGRCRQTEMVGRPTLCGLRSLHL